MFEVIKKMFLGTTLMFIAFGLLFLVKIDLFSKFFDWNKDALIKTLVVISIIFAFQTVFLIHYYIGLYFISFVNSIEDKKMFCEMNGKSTKKLTFTSWLFFTKATMLKWTTRKRKTVLSDLKAVKASQTAISFITIVLYFSIAFIVIFFNKYFLLLLIATPLTFLLFGYLHFVVLNEITRYKDLFVKSSREIQVPDLNFENLYNKRKK